jgi:hypothetical protein
LTNLINRIYKADLIKEALLRIPVVSEVKVERSNIEDLTNITPSQFNSRLEKLEYAYRMS